MVSFFQVSTPFKNDFVDVAAKQEDRADDKHVKSDEVKQDASLHYLRRER